MKSIYSAAYEIFEFRTTVAVAQSLWIVLMYQADGYGKDTPWITSSTFAYYILATLAYILPLIQM